MDLNKLRSTVFEKTGIRIDTNDPIFALVALNEAVLTECIEQQVSIANHATAKLAEQSRQLLEAGERHRKILLQVASTENSANSTDVPIALLDESEETEKIRSGGVSTWQLIAIGCAIAILTSSLTIGGLSAFKERSQPVPAQVVQKIAPPPTVAPLTAEQQVLIRDGERFAKMWARMDEATQLKIQGLIDQP